MKVVLLVAAVLIGIVSARGAEAEPARPAESAGTLFDRFQVADKSLVDALKALRTTYDAEEAAGRIAKTDHGLASFLQVVESTHGGRRDLAAVDFFLQSGLRRSENPTVEAARKKLKEAAEARRDLQRQSLGRLVDEAFREAGEAWRRAQRPADLTPTIDRLEVLQAILQDAMDNDAASRRLSSVSELIDYLGRFKTWLDASATNDTPLTSSSLLALRVTKSPFGDAVSLKEIEERTDNGQAQLLPKVDAAFEEMLRVLPKARRPEEVEPVVDRLLQAAEIASRFQPRNGDNRATRAPYLAAKWMEMLARERDHEWGIVVQLVDRHSAEWQEYAPGLLGELQAHRQAAERNEKEEQLREQQEFQQSLKADLKKVETVRELTALLEKVQADLREERESPLAQQYRLAESMLSSLVQQVRALEAGLLPAVDPSAGLRRAYGSFADEIGPLLDKFTRRALADRTDHPEILQPPLLNLPVNEALQRVAKQLAERGEWRRLYQLLLSRPASSRGESNDGPSPEVAKVRAFLYAQNLEKAELWQEAAASYRTVLSALDQPTLVAAATARLKALKQKHASDLSPAK